SDCARFLASDFAGLVGEVFAAGSSDRHSAGQAGCALIPASDSSFKVRGNHEGNPGKSLHVGNQQSNSRGVVQARGVVKHVIAAYMKLCDVALDLFELFAALAEEHSDGGRNYQLADFVIE